MNIGVLALSWIGTAIHYLNFTLLLLSVIIFIDILLVFKNPTSLKILFLAVAICIFITNLASLLEWSYFYKYIPKTIVFFLFVQILYHLYNHTVSKKLNIFFSIILLSTVYHIYSIDQITPNSHNFLFWFRRVLRFGALICAISAAIYVYKNLQTNLKKGNIVAKKIESWTKMTIVLFILSVLINAIQTLGENYIPIALLSICIIQIICCFGIIYRPAFINRGDLSSANLNIILKKGKFKAIEENVFVHEFYTKHYFTNINATDLEFSNMLGVDVEILNEYISTISNMDFIDLINKNRVDYFIMLTTNKEFKDHSIEKLSELAGFKTRHIFYRAFRKFHGGSPTELIKMNEL
jgi:AraC-like DNA-binding protein